MQLLVTNKPIQLQEQALKAAERLRTVRELQLTENIAIINNGPKEARSLEPLSTELEARREQVTQRLWTTAAELMENSDVEYSFDDGSEDEEESRAIGDGKFIDTVIVLYYKFIMWFEGLRNLYRPKSPVS